MSTSANENSRDDLITALRRCLTCHPSFAPFALPLLLEKLDSDLDSAKLDSNLTLIKYLAVLEPHHLAPFLSELWSAYKKELMGIRMTPSTTQAGKLFVPFFVRPNFWFPEMGQYKYSV